MRRSSLLGNVSLLLPLLLLPACTEEQLSPGEDGVEPTVQTDSGSCGVERWSVKTGTDADVGKVNLTPVPATIAALGALAAPKTLPSNNRVSPTELQIVTLTNVNLIQYKLESDSDIHLDISDGTATMIAEIPSPSCVGATSRFSSAISASRTAFTAKYTPTPSFQTANVPVTITGVSFFDMPHGQSYVAPNAIEIHPILSICFGTNCSTGPTCGGSGQSCCMPGNTCGTGLTCQGGTCVPTTTCGGNGQSCCTGNTCNTGLTCQGGTCAPPAGSCAHSICVTGTKLTSTCDPCVTKICAKDSYCCNTKWSSQCVSEVASICGESCTADMGMPPPDMRTGNPDLSGTNPDLRTPPDLSSGGGHIKTVFLILMENTNWSQIKGSSSAPYINGLLSSASYATHYMNPPGNHPSLPNYLWLEAGTNFGITADGVPSMYHQSTTQHLVTLLQNAGITWRAYEEAISGTSCPLTASGLYAPKHLGAIFFDDVTNTNSATSMECITHIRPYTQLATDLSAHTTAQYNFITPNLCDDMHNLTGCANSDHVKNGDTWLSTEIPKLMASDAYKNNGAIFITWDESEGGDVPIGMIVLSPLGKGGGYNNSIAYTHSSTLRTMQEIFGVTPLLGDAKNATDLADLFTTFP